MKNIGVFETVSFDPTTLLGISSAFGAIDVSDF
jgi:hypothetical protein